MQLSTQSDQQESWERIKKIPGVVELSQEEREKLEADSVLLDYSPFHPLELAELQQLPTKINLQILLLQVNIHASSPLSIKTNDDLRKYVMKKLLTTVDKTNVDISTPTLSTMKNHVPYFIKTIRTLVEEKECRVRLIFGNPQSKVFQTISKDKEGATKRITEIIDGLRDIIGSKLYIYLHDEVFFNATYHFGSELVVNNYVMGNSNTVTSTISNSKSNAELIQIYEKQFENLIHSEHTKPVEVKKTI